MKFLLSVGWNSPERIRLKSSVSSAFVRCPDTATEIFPVSSDTTMQTASFSSVRPIAARCRVYFCGHDHFYERSELPGGLTEIITGGAGAPRYAKSKAAEDQNPYGKVFLSKTHFCVIDVQADKASLKALQPDGEEIDSLEFKPRN